MFTLTDKVAMIILAKAPWVHVPDSLPRNAVVGTQNRCAFNFTKNSQCALPKYPSGHVPKPWGKLLSLPAHLPQYTK